MHRGDEGLDAPTPRKVDGKDGQQRRKIADRAEYGGRGVRDSHRGGQLGKIHAARENVDPIGKGRLKRDHPIMLFSEEILFFFQRLHKLFEGARASRVGLMGENGG